MSYDYRKGKKRVQDLLNRNLTIEEKKKISSVSDLTHENSYKAWITGIFIDIRESAELFSKEDQVMVSKMIKAFTSEVITILRDTDVNCLEQGIRGDCVYAVYSSPQQDDVNSIIDLAYWVNTLMSMLNKLFEKKGYHSIKVGIGISTHEELIIKAGRYQTSSDDNIDHNAIVWVGKAVSLASKFSSYGNKDSINPIVISSCTYENINDDNKKFFTSEHSIYHGNVVKTEFDDWIKGGML